MKKGTKKTKVEPTKAEEPIQVENVSPVVPEEPKPEIISEPKPAPIKIAPFSGDFGREDFNKLRDKVNEVIDFINK
jgi:hypothetical protein